MTGWLCFFAWVFSFGPDTPLVVSVLVFLAMMNEVV
jgi:hypothetical protein